MSVSLLFSFNFLTINRLSIYVAYYMLYHTVIYIKCPNFGQINVKN